MSVGCIFLGNLDIWAKYHGNPSKFCWDISVLTKIMVFIFLKQINWGFSPFCPQRPCIHFFQLSWTPTHSPARRMKRRRMELEVQKEKRKEGKKERWMTCLPYHPKLPGLWKCIAVPWCCRGKRVCLHLSPPKPLATSFSSPTPPYSILCWREVRGNRLKKYNGKWQHVV